MWKPPSDIADRPILVIGGSSLGRRIACTWISAGFNVKIQELDFQDRAMAVQYVVTNVRSYMKKTGSTQRGIITGSERLESIPTLNPWLVIDALPGLLSLKEDKEFRAKLAGDLDSQLPDDCILAVHDGTSTGILRDVKKPHRVVIIHHYLIPNARIVEVVKLQKTANSIVDFLFEMIPKTGSLPILAKDEASAGAFMKIWNAMKTDIYGLSTHLLYPQDIDAGWDYFLQMSSTGEMDDWFEVLDREHGDEIEQSYRKVELHQKPILAYLKDMMMEEGNRVAYDGHALYNLCFSRPGPNIFFIDCGDLESSKLRLGRILCASTDGAIREIATGLRLPYALSIHIASKRIYWSDLLEGTISSCSYDGSARAIIIPGDGHPAPKHIAIDQEKSQLYWTQSEAGQIMRCNFDGTDIECVLNVEHKTAATSQDSKTSLNAITLDSSRRHLYWSQKSSINSNRHSIKRTSMDLPNGCYPNHRTDIETLFDNLPEVIDIDFVPVYDEVYWSAKTTTTNKVHRGYVGPCPDYGMDKQNLVIRDLEGMGWVKVDPRTGYLYMTYVIGFLYRFDMTTGKGQLRIHGDGSAAFLGIGLLHGPLDWKQDDWDVYVDTEGENGGNKNGCTKGRIIGKDGIADDVNSESTGTLSTVGTDETETIVGDDDQTTEMTDVEMTEEEN